MISPGFIAADKARRAAARAVLEQAAQAKAAAAQAALAAEPESSARKGWQLSFWDWGTPGVIHVATTAWKRYDLAETTLRTFAQHNAGGWFRLWYSLEAGYDERLPALFDKYGYTCLVRNLGQQGIARTTERLVSCISEGARPGELLLLLQDDWQCLRPVPLDVVAAVFALPDVGVLRLTWTGGEAKFGGFKKKPTEVWVDVDAGGESLIVGRGYWAHVPTITRMELAVHLLRRAPIERTSIERSERMMFLSAWIDRPVFHHTGFDARCRHQGGKE
jgi:hypothetical protein